MTGSYHHTQVGYLMIGALGVGAAVAGYSAVRTGSVGVIAVFILLGAALLVFSRLTTVVRDKTFEVFFGLGLVRRRISLNEVREVHVVRNPWYCGWGIRWIGNGWLWNVSGLDAIELRLRDGRRFRVGSDEPERLAAAIQAERAA